MKNLILVSLFAASFAHASLRVNNAAVAGRVQSITIQGGMVTLFLSNGSQMQVGTMGLRGLGISPKELVDLVNSSIKGEIDLNVIAPTSSHSSLAQVTGLTIVPH